MKLGLYTVAFPMTPVFFSTLERSFNLYDHLALTHFNQVSYFGF